MDPEEFCSLMKGPESTYVSLEIERDNSEFKSVAGLIEDCCEQIESSRHNHIYLSGIEPASLFSKSSISAFTTPPDGADPSDLSEDLPWRVQSAAESTPPVSTLSVSADEQVTIDSGEREGVEPLCVIVNILEVVGLPPAPPAGHAYCCASLFCGAPGAPPLDAAPPFPVSHDVSLGYDADELSYAVVGEMLHCMPQQRTAALEPSSAQGSGHCLSFAAALSIAASAASPPAVRDYAPASKREVAALPLDWQAVVLLLSVHVFAPGRASTPLGHVALPIHCGHMHEHWLNLELPEPPSVPPAGDKGGFWTGSVGTPEAVGTEEYRAVRVRIFYGLRQGVSAVWLWGLSQDQIAPDPSGINDVGVKTDAVPPAAPPRQLASKVGSETQALSPGRVPEQEIATGLPTSQNEAQKAKYDADISPAQQELASLAAADRGSIRMPPPPSLPEPPPPPTTHDLAGITAQLTDELAEQVKANILLSQRFRDSQEECGRLRAQVEALERRSFQKRVSTSGVPATSPETGEGSSEQMTRDLLAAERECTRFLHQSLKDLNDEYRAEVQMLRERCAEHEAAARRLAERVHGAARRGARLTVEPEVRPRSEPHLSGQLSPTSPVRRWQPESPVSIKSATNGSYGWTTGASPKSAAAISPKSADSLPGGSPSQLRSLAAQAQQFDLAALLVQENPDVRQLASAEMRSQALKQELLSAISCAEGVMEKILKQ